MDVVQFLFAVVNLLLALVVLFGGRLIFERLTELREDVDALKKHFPDELQADEELPNPILNWKE
jgi:hypothetical protein